MLGNTSTVDPGVGQVLGSEVSSSDPPLPHARLLQDLFQSSTAMEFVSLCYVDGRPLASVGDSPPQHAVRVAAMASSFLALSETFAKEASHERCSYATITSTKGLIVVARVPSPNRLLVLCAAASRRDSLAMILRRTLDCADSLAAVVP